MIQPIAKRIALVGMPNCGKTALFNRLTGNRQKVANYAGVTVERKEGRFVTPNGAEITVLDLPGAYSLVPASLDEAVTRDVLRGFYPGEAAPDLIVCVADATNLRMHLRLVAEVTQLGLPMVLVLNMQDAADNAGIVIDREKLSRDLSIPVVSTVAVRNDGVSELLALLDQPAPLAPTLKLEDRQGDVYSNVSREWFAGNVTMPKQRERFDDRMDRVLLHPAWGLIILTVLMFVMFQAVYAWAEPLIEGIETMFASLGEFVGTHMADGPLKSLMVDGIIAGVGGVLVFLPQILILFLFILTLEESGYLPRAAFLLDRIMGSAGLSGRSFIPLLSSFACAVPGIMATRSIPDPRDRLATILVAPLMTCSARLPVYALLIGAFIPATKVAGPINLQGLVLFGLYVAGIISALIVSWFLKKWRKDKSEHALLLELPAYRWPNIRDLLIGLYERAMIFIKRVGGIILAMTVLLWFLLTFPSAPADATMPAIDYSFAGQLGHLMQKIFAPIGFNWQIAIALIPGMAAREVVVASLGTIYSMQGATDDSTIQMLTPVISQQWSLATALSLLVWFIYAPQCISTLAIIRRETSSWSKVAITAGYLFALAYGASLLTYHVAKAFGLG